MHLENLTNRRLQKSENQGEEGESVKRALDIAY